jgi:Ca2+-binding EF-hand superfamily protein
MKQINDDVWTKFEQAFVTYDVDLFKSIHTQDILRIPADKKVIVPSEEYFESQDKSFNWIKENNYQTKIELKFIERICNASHASERGIFKFTIIDNETKERIIYGKFHVLLKKTDEKWKIFFDYDSNEDGTITAESFKNAYGKWNFEPFIH